MTSLRRLPVHLSVLDRSLTREGEHPAQALRETVRFAQQAEELGFLRFWVSEHHAVPGIAGSAPTVLASAVASATSRIRVGTGGVMLPNHQPLVVAEQFGVLESLFPGRIDMGLGRSVGFTDGIRKALRVGKDAAEGFGEQISELLGYFEGTGPVRARPAEGLRVPPFVLAVGSGAAIAAEHGLPLVIGASRDEQRTREAARTYREAFRPREDGGSPYVVVAVNAAVADTREQAARLQIPEAWSTAVSRTRGSFTPLIPADEVLARTMTPKEREAFEEARLSQLHGTESEVTEALAGLAERVGADEILLTLNTYDPADRLDSYRRLARAAGTGERRTGAAASSGPSRTVAHS
ncbi:LLM class flavin-dependent oxidoreductase [Streptomyces sp. NBC_01795]|uniref:LLM class flavin-dependent oxidoreductase n=1 Tax=Streptomyces sp. NBC_01795 TaxID=2975943 RepID=UPI002DDBF122|nr:LLM class flavin-dependent oxidoreductase [Streptomyces sp. NBC_01795]WSA90477.1 LLM class flavin-dependent oxidoreductase [Streptomyces sp. NBC_01795]